MRVARSPKQQRLGRFLILFCVCFLTGFALLVAPPVKAAAIRFSGALVTVAGSLIHLAGGSARVEGAVLRNPNTGLAVEMKDGCNGLYVTLLLCSALVAFRAPWSRRAKGILIGIVAIQLVNLLRFVSLYYLLQFNQAWFDFAHQYLWESLIMLDALAVFWFWVRACLDDSEPRL